MPQAAARGDASPVVAFLESQTFRAIVYQFFTAGTVAFLLWYVSTNAADNLVRQGIATGFSFLQQEAGYDVGEKWIEHSARDSYAQTILVGLLNTLYVSVLGVILATLLGTLLGIARVSRNWLSAKLSAAYVEVFRNTPLLLQIIFWYALLRQLPPPRQALDLLPGVFLTNRGLIHPTIVSDPIHLWILGGLILGVALSVLLVRRSRLRREKTGKALPVFWPSAATITGLPLLIWIAWGMPFTLDVPALRGFNFTGGTYQSPELVALVTGLVTYISAFIAEIVRSGIESVGHGQREAARSLGLREGHILRLVVLPQALRVIVPPLTGQYLNLVKDSSLAVYIGYPDLVSVSNTAVNQTGQAVEIIFLMMLVYLTISLSISLLMNWYNRAIALRG
ncbi:MAG: ABC transporter permease subunit [Acetobacterales bacterium]